MTEPQTKKLAEVSGSPSCLLNSMGLEALERAPSAWRRGAMQSAPEGQPGGSGTHEAVACGDYAHGIVDQGNGEGQELKAPSDCAHSMSTPRGRADATAGAGGIAQRGTAFGWPVHERGGKCGRSATLSAPLWSGS